MTGVAALRPADDSRECVIEAHDLVKSFGPTPALRGAILAIRAGEIVAVMGPSGSGKSTLLHCLAGILVPEAGGGVVRRPPARHDPGDGAERPAPGPVRLRVPVRSARSRADRSAKSLRLPGAHYYLIAAAGILAALGRAGPVSRRVIF